jgi:GTP pyrophosphokinase
MVAVLHSAPEVAAPEALAAWTERVSEGFTPDERVKLLATLDAARSLYGDRCASDGEPWLDRALGTAAIVAGLKLDIDSVCAAVMIGAPHADAFDAEAFGARFGTEVAQLVNGVARMGAIKAIPDDAPAHDRDAHSESLRKMLLAMVGDIRVVLIKLAERTQALRYLVSHEGVAAAQAARETQDLFAPLANRLGVWQLKWELEDLSLRALEPETYIFTASGPRCAASRPASMSCTTSARCASWSTKSRIAIPRLVSCTTCGRRW